MTRPEIPGIRLWPRNLSTSQGGGLSTSQSGGMSTSSGLVYMSNIPPWPHFVRELEARSHHGHANLIRQHLPQSFWPEKFFQQCR